ncbi:MAG: rod shape-determining protein MreD [Nitrospirae bacterium]|nr:rod shape-determining protein MreD [Nitrospirota bacterium]MBI3605401.1 rod shape-determining protein MreD [Nitrospirota bacterium]
MKKNFLIVGLIVLIPAQGIVGDYFSIGRVKPDLGFLAIYFAGLLFGYIPGGFAGAGIGLVADILSGGTALVQMECGMLLGLGSGMIRRTMLNLKIFFNSLIIFVFSILHSFLVFIFLNMSLKETHVPAPWKDLILPKGVYDAFLGSFLFWLLMKFLKNRNFSGESLDLERISIFTSRKP